MDNNQQRKSFMSNNTTTDLNVNKNVNQLTDAVTRTEPSKGIVGYTCIPNKLTADISLSPTARFLLTYMLSQHPTKWVFHDSNLCAQMHCKQGKLKLLFAELRKAGYVKIVPIKTKTGFSGSKRIFSNIPEYLTIENPESAFSTPSGIQTVTETHSDNNNNNFVNNTKTINKTNSEYVSNLSEPKEMIPFTESKKSAPQAAHILTADIEKVFKHWQIVRRHPQAKLDAKRKALISKALKSYSLADCLQAIDGCNRSPYHNGTEDGKIYDSLGLIFRDADKIEGFMEKAHHEPVSKPKATDWREERAKTNMEGYNEGVKAFNRLVSGTYGKVDKKDGK